MPAVARDVAREKLARRLANAAVELLRLHHPDLVWPLLEKVVEGDAAAAIAEAQRVAARSLSYDSALEEIATILHRVALAQAGAEGSDEPDTDRVRAMAENVARGDSGKVSAGALPPCANRMAAARRSAATPASQAATRAADASNVRGAAGACEGASFTMRPRCA